MQTSIKKTLLLALPLLLATALPAQEEQAISKSIFIEWSPTPGNHGYILQIRDESGKLVQEKRTTVHRHEFQLPAGSYAQRVGILNKFQKISLWSPWKSFQVELALTPQIESIEPKKPYRNKSSGKITLRGRNFKDTTDWWRGAGRPRRSARWPGRRKPWPMTRTRWSCRWTRRLRT